MKTFLAALLSSCLLAGIATAEDKKPLDNQGLNKIREEWRGNADEVTGIKGKAVKLKVMIRVRQDNSVWCTLISPDGKGRMTCHAHLDNITKDTYELKEGEVCLIEGVIAADALCYSAFWIDVNKLTRLEQNPASAKKP